MCDTTGLVQRIRKVAGYLGVLALGLLVLSGPCFGQIKSGTIVGTVVDANGGVVPGAQITVVNQETNIASTAVSGGSGDFTVPYLQAGTYTVNIEKAESGLGRYSVRNLAVGTAQTVQLQVTLKVAGTESTVTVQADATTLQTSSASVENTVEQQTIQTLPNITHNAFTYAALQPGVVPRGKFSDSQSSTSFGIGIDGRREASAIGINGGPAFSNDILLDGVSIQGAAWNETAVMPNADSLQEVKTITNNYSAEYGRAQGVIIFTTKSGGNQFHGSAFYRIRNDAMNANSFSNNALGIHRPPFKYNSFGGSTGGPILRDKAFFFVSYEGLYFHRGYDYSLTVPTAAERTGDFSKTVALVKSGAPQYINLYNPYNVTPDAKKGVYDLAPLSSNLPTNPGLTLNPYGLLLLQSYPMPNHTPSDPFFNTGNFFDQETQQFTRHDLNSRLDYHWRKNYFYATYGFQRANIHTPSAKGYGPACDNICYSQIEFIGNEQPDDNFYTALGDTLVLSPTLILDLRLGVNRIEADDRVDTDPNFNYSALGIPADIQAVNTAFVGAPPQFNPGGHISALDNGTSLHKVERQTNADINGSMTWTHGSWTHKFGGTYRDMLSNYIDGEDSSQIQTSANFTRANINADGSTTGLPAEDATNSGLPMASILLGAGDINISPGYQLRMALSQKYFALYSQNDWRVNRRLTLNLGLRWDLQPGPTERHDRLSSLDLNAKEPLFGTAGAIVLPGQNGAPRNMWRTQWNDFGPRVGVAYELGNSMVVRGGYGLTYVPSNTGFNDGPGFYGVQPYTPSVIHNPYGASPAGQVVGAFNSDTGANPVDQILPAVGANLNSPGLYGGQRRFSYDLKDGYVQQWNVFIEKKFGTNWMISAGYIGSRGTHLQVAYLNTNDVQLLDPTLLATWRSSYIASNGTNPATQQICNPYQTMQSCLSNPDGTFKSASGPIIQYGSGYLPNRSITNQQANYPYPLEGDTNITESIGYSTYHALQLEVTHQFSAGLLLSANYTYSRQMAADRYNAQTNQGYNDSSATNYFPYRRADQLSLNNQITTNDIPHRLAVNWYYLLPFGKGTRFDTHNGENAMIGGWSLSGSFIAQSGFVTPISGATNALDNLPDLVPGAPLEVPKALQHWYDGKTTVTLPDGRMITPCANCFLKYNIDAFTARTVTGADGKTILPDLFWYGNSPVSFDGMRSNPFWNVNMSLAKTFKIGETRSLTVSGQATNLFNHTEFKPGLNTGLGATILPKTVSSNPGSTVGQLANGNTFGTYGLSTYDARQIEVVASFRF